MVEPEHVDAGIVHSGIDLVHALLREPAQELELLVGEDAFEDEPSLVAILLLLGFRDDRVVVFMSSTVGATAPPEEGTWWAGLVHYGQR